MVTRVDEYFLRVRPSNRDLTSFVAFPNLVSISEQEGDLRCVIFLRGDAGLGTTLQDKQLI